MTIIKHRRGTAAEWAASNRVLEYGELGIEYDTYRLKIGDGAKPWLELPYAINELTIQDINTYVQTMQSLSDSTAASAAAAAASEQNANDAASEAADISNIAVSDDVVEALLRNFGGGGPKTSAALEELVGLQIDSAIAVKTDTYISATEPPEATEGDFWLQP